jgi:hypothetical protein
MLTPTECLAKATEARLFASLTTDDAAKAIWAQPEGLWARLAHMGDAQEDLEEKFDSREPCR